MEKMTLLTTNMDIYRHPRHVPGYLGYTPRIKFTYGETYGNTTARWFQDYRASQLNTSKERMGRGGDKFLPFPTYYTNNPDHVLGARTSSRDRWLAAPKYKLLNLDDRDTAIKKYDKAAQQHREHYRDKTETVPPVRIFILPKIFHNTKCHRIPVEAKTANEEKAIAYANKVYRTMKAEPLAKSSVETRRIRDVFFERR
ncbi:unnamed protein product [Porites lobata]|uniref:Ciliary microtubule inner protein 2C n=1 Tax=Porites lobata TaxID=104759 RepID=A0ABN8SE17_9CNID|nr:unnamed protein product [Porites lobata]CAH3189804.1 unnamed protein product [Porites lobata]